MKIIAEKYLVERELGGGSSGTVYAARHRDLGLLYAVKVLNPGLSQQEHFITRFRREAEILSKFSHSGTVQLRDFGRLDDGRYYMATDFCLGETLSAYVEKQGWVPVFAALRIMDQILDVVGAAHAAGIVHRDLKPANILIEQQDNGELKVSVLDFGIALIRDFARAVGAKERSTEEGMAVGTPEYMSPEQAAGESDVDERSDLYACGIILFELLSGRVPFKGDGVVQTLLKQLTQPVPLFPDDSGLPSELNEIIAKALAKDRNDRFQTAAQFAEALRELERSFSAGPAQDSPLETQQTLAVGEIGDEVLQLDTKKILVLDDNQMILQVMKHVLEKDGFTVFLADKYESVADTVRGHGVGLMLCDVQMPGIPGTKVCQLLKLAIPELKIALFSNIPERDLEKLAKSCGADDFISKNGKPDAWLAKVRELAGEKAP